VKTDIRIHPMSDDDSLAVATLLPDLGYSASPEDISTRLKAIRAWPDQEVLLAWHAQSVVGLCQVQGVKLIASNGYAEVQALVVAATHQRRGIGSALVQRAVLWASDRLYDRIRLRSGVHREGAHLFYQSLGFSKSRASFAFEMSPQHLHPATAAT
jgi:GNAT superfamily N-acetyltransferase